MRLRQSAEHPGFLVPAYPPNNVCRPECRQSAGSPSDHSLYIRFLLLHVSFGHSCTWRPSGLVAPGVRLRSAFLAPPEQRSL